MRYKKGQVGVYITVIVGLVIAITLLVNLAFPQMRTIYQSQTITEDLTAHVLGVNTSTTLANTDLVLASVSVAGLTLSDNYTVDYTTAVITVNDTTANGTYTASYSFYGAGYIDSSGTRALAGVVILFLIVGLVAGAFKMFGLL